MKSWRLRVVILIASLATACSSPTGVSSSGTASSSGTGGASSSSGPGGACTGSACTCGPGARVNRLTLPPPAGAPPGCLPVKLPVDAQGQVVVCAILEARATDGGACDCSAVARGPVPMADACLQQIAAQDPYIVLSHLDCFCEVTQATGAALTSCQNAVTNPTGDGWCYIDATTTPPIGNPALVQNCVAAEKHSLRFIGQGMPSAGAALLLACH
jgi:hypothetical protein